MGLKIGVAFIPFYKLIEAFLRFLFLFFLIRQMSNYVFDLNIYRQINYKIEDHTNVK